MTDIFDRIYRTNEWNGVESRSGPGSGTAATRHVAAAVVDLVAELEVQAVVDVACGDGFWMPDLPGYVGMDVSAEALELARARHPERTYVLGQIGRVMPVRGDLAIVRDVLQHLSFADATRLLTSIELAGFTWLLASTYAGTTNVDIETGAFYSPNLEISPFSLGPPERTIFDGYGYQDPDEVRDPAKYLGLWRLR